MRHWAMLLVMLLCGCEATDFAGGALKNGRANAKTPGGPGADGANDGNGGGGGGADAQDGGPDAGAGSGAGDGGAKGGADPGKAPKPPGSEGGADDGGLAGDDGAGPDKDPEDPEVDHDPLKKVDLCEIPKGAVRQTTLLGGEDVPGNGLVGGPDEGSPLGSDFDDYVLTFAGELAVQHGPLGVDAKIGNKKKGTKIAVSYKRGTSDCTHGFKILLRKCPNKSSKVVGSFVFEPGINEVASFDFEFPEANLFMDVEMTSSVSPRNKAGGCPLPIPVKHLLYGGGVPAIIL